MALWVHFLPVSLATRPAWSLNSISDTASLKKVTEMVSNSQRETIVDGSYSNTMMWCFMFAVEVHLTVSA
jgi:hypothetical protein